MIDRIPALLDTINTPGFILTSEDVSQQSGCLFQACVRLKNLTLHRPGHQITPLADLSLRIPPAWPPRLILNNTTTNSPIRLDVDLFFDGIRIRSLQGRLDRMMFHISGKINTTHETGQLSAQTIGLKSFIRPFIAPEVMTFLNFIISDMPQTLLIKPQNGYLTLQGIPLFPLPE